MPSSSVGTPSVASLPADTPSFAAASSTTTASEVGEDPSDLSTVTSRTRSRTDSKSPNRRGFLSRMTSSTSTNDDHSQHQQHHGGLLDKVKSIYSQRPSSRDRGSSGSRERESGAHREDGHSLHLPHSHHDGERGRSGEPMVSVGRGGAGNIRASSKTRAREQELSEGEQEARERSRERSRDRGHTAGRGGAGNFRSPSMDPAKRAEDAERTRLAGIEEKAAIEKRAAEDAKLPQSHGRGGAGNIGT